MKKALSGRGKQKISVWNKAFSGKALSAGEYYGLYTLAFLMTAALVYSFYLFNGKSFVYCDLDGGGDGLVQHYSTFVYLGKWMRNILRHLYREHRLLIPTWDLNIGYGQDIISTLNFYGLGDPLNLLSAVTPTRYAELIYCFLILLRLYLAGITFSVYCRYRKLRGGSVLTGSMIYVFCHYAIVIGTLHFEFTVPMVLFPLMCLGAEKIFSEDKHGLFIASCAIEALSSFYMFYIACMLIVLYAIIRYIAIWHTVRSLHFAKTVLLFLRDGVLSAGLAAALMLPSAMAILGASRVGADNIVPVLYDAKYYLNLLPSFISGGGQYYAHLGYCAIGLMSVLAMFLCRKKKVYRPVMAAFIVMALMLCIPFAGHFMNGMGYVVNRWVWGLSFFMGYLTAVMIPEMQDFDSSKWKKLLGLVCVYTLIILLDKPARTEFYMASLVVLIITAGSLYLAAKAGRREAFAGLAFFLTIVMIFQNAYYTFSPSESDRLNRHVDFGEAYRQLTEASPAYVAAQSGRNGHYRYDTAGISVGDVKRNAGMLLGQPGIPFYFSTVGAGPVDFIHLLRLNYDAEASWPNLDRRSMLDLLVGVKYFVVPAGTKWCLPYGYRKTILETEHYDVHKSSLALPLAFIADRFITRETFDALSTPQKQEALLQTVVLEETQNTAELSLQETTYIPEMEAEEGIVVGDGQITVYDTSAKLILKTQGRTDGELYVELENLSFDALSPKETCSSETWDKMSRLERNQVLERSRYWMEPTSAWIWMSCGVEGSGFIYRTPENPYYSRFDDCLCNLGYSSSDDREDITVTFNTPGIYSFDSLTVTRQPMEDLKTWRALLVRDAAALQIGTNQIKCNAEIEEEGLLFLSIAYSDGWTAFVDGEETPVLKADTAFMGVKVPAGKHEITLRYDSPWVREGLMISLVSLCTFLLLMVHERRKKKKQQPTAA